MKKQKQSEKNANEKTKRMIKNGKSVKMWHIKTQDGWQCLSTHDNKPAASLA